MSECKPEEARLRTELELEREAHAKTAERAAEEAAQLRQELAETEQRRADTLRQLETERSLWLSRLDVMDARLTAAEKRQAGLEEKR